MLHQFGHPSPRLLDETRQASFHSGNFFCAAMDEVALWDPATIDEIVHLFPADLMPVKDLYLILSECFANAALHGRAQALGVHARQRHNVTLVSFFQMPPMQSQTAMSLSLARKGLLPDYANSDDVGGLGLPILMRLCYRVTISRDYKKLQLWFRAGQKQI